MSGALLLRSVRLGVDEPLHDVRVRGALVEAIAPVGELSAEPGDEVVEGGALLPGFVDGHLHAATWAAALKRLDVSGARTAVEAAELLRTHPSATSAYGFRDALWPDRPHKDLLPDRPLVLLSADLHAVWMSRPMLAQLGVDHPTGVVRDEEGLALMARIDAMTPQAEADAAVHDATRVLASRGVTGVLDFEYCDGRSEWLRRLESATPLVRVTAVTWAPWLDRTQERTGEQVRGLLRQGPLKVMVDGSLNTRTAACHEPYPDAADGRGQLYVQPEELVDLMRRAQARGLSTAAHAIGDRATTIVLDAFEEVGCAGRIEHAQQIRAVDLARVARPDVTLSIQPQHAMDDRDVADALWPGASLAFAYGSLHRAGGRLQIGSDAPVSPSDPLAAVADAVTRTADARPPWHPDEALPLDVALAAACAGRTRVQVGDVADLVHLAEHPLLVGASDVRHVPVRTTVLDGIVTFRTD